MSKEVYCAGCGEKVFKDDPVTKIEEEVYHRWCVDFEGDDQ